MSGAGSPGAPAAGVSRRARVYGENARKTRFKALLPAAGNEKQ